MGVPIANRTQQEVSSLIGFFANTLVFRTQIDEHQNFVQLLNDVKQTTQSGYEHQDMPFEQLVEKLVRTRDLSRTPLFQAMFVLQNQKEVGEMYLGEDKVTAIEFSSIISKFDLELTAIEMEDGLNIHIDYSTALFKKETIERMSPPFY